MPYIKQDERKELEPLTVLMDKTPIKSEGQLNYLITQLVRSYLCQQPRVGYGQINGVVGVLECAKLELYRRVAEPYENIKINENGDVYLD